MRPRLPSSPKNLDGNRYDRARKWTYAPAIWLKLNVSLSAISIVGVPPVEMLTACAKVSCAPIVAAHASNAAFEGSSSASASDASRCAITGQGVALRPVGPVRAASQSTLAARWDLTWFRRRSKFCAEKEPGVLMRVTRSLMSACVVNTRGCCPELLKAPESSG